MSFGKSRTSQVLAELIPQFSALSFWSLGRGKIEEKTKEETAFQQADQRSC
jgi:hypothetical protein